MKAKGNGILGGYEENSPLYVCGCEYDNKVFFFPYYGKKLKILDLQGETIEYHDLKFKETSSELLAACSCIVYKRMIYVFSWNQAANAMVIVNPETYEAFPYHIRANDIEIYPNSYSSNCLVGDDIWISANEKGTLIQYKTISREFIVHRVNGCNDIIHTVNFDGKYFWLTGEMDLIVRWDYKTNEVTEFNDWPEGFMRTGGKSPWKGMFYGGFCHDNKIFYAPLEANQFLELDCSIGKMVSILTIENSEYCYGCNVLHNNSYFVEIKRGVDQSLVCGYMIGEHIEPHKIEIYDGIDNCDEIFECRLKNNYQCLQENSFMRLEEYVHYLSNE